MRFNEWYDSTIVPQLNETLKNMPVPAREPLRTASRQTMAACWNAAIEAVLIEAESTKIDNYVEVEKLKVKIS